MSEWNACRDCELGTSPLCELCRGYHPVRGRNSELTALRAELEQVRAMHDRATEVIATSEETRIALQRELEQVRGERDEAIEEMEGAVKLREAADACITRLEASCYQWQAENLALREALRDVQSWIKGAVELHYGERAIRIIDKALSSPLTTAEAERVRALEAVAEAFAEEWNDSPKCTCHEAYKNRNRDDPDCLYHKSPLLWDALAAWREGEGTGDA